MESININKVIIHELIKEQHKKIQPSNLRTTLLEAGSDPVVKLVTGITSLYGKRNNSAHYGTFRNDEGRGTFPDDFESYSSVSNPTDQQFINLTKTAMKVLYKKAEGMHAASGGYMLYADYSNAQGRYFIAAMIKQKEGLTLSKQLEPEELTQLDLSRLYQAAKISFGKLSAYRAASQEESLEINYLSFVSPSASKSAAGYFVTALGCAPGTASAQATTTIIKESVNFFRNNEQLKPHRQTFKNLLLDYLAEKEGNGESVKLSEVESLARRFFPADEDDIADEIADKFISHLNSEECGVPVEFPVNKAALNRSKRIHYKSDNWDLSFERNSLGTKSDARVFFDKANKRLILNDLPNGAINLIEEEIENQRE